MRRQEAGHKTLILIRHAHRDTSDRDANNGLSSKGEKQASLLAKYFKTRFEEQDAELYSSPKKRCIETLADISAHLDRKVVILKCLDESESQTELGKRIVEFMKFFKASSSPIVVACSHGDWIPEFMDRVLKMPIALEKGAWAEIVFEPEKPRLAELIQDFSFLKK